MIFNINSSYCIDNKGFLGEIREGRRSMPFLIRLSKNPSIDRAVVILHGHGNNERFSRFMDDKWTVIIPLDTYGYEGKGSWWLGESGDFFTFRMLQELIRILKEKYSLPSIYFWGSSMGGYGAILHGILMKSVAVFAHIPQIKLFDTQYTDGKNLKFYKDIFGKDANKKLYGDLCNVVKDSSLKRSPVIYLSQNTRDSQSYLLEHTLPFIEACDNKGMALDVIMPLYAGHTFKSTVAKTIEETFNQNYKIIRHWRLYQEIL